ncbi:MAG: PDZ domain-containing protein, partial [Muribaculaceae bacterium]|nr:PDZ domain-containing protein [Muribaculaceae bacterium]
MKKPSYNKFLQFGLPLIVIIALLAGILLGSHLRFRPSASDSAAKKVEELFALISSDYVDEVNLDSLLEEAIPDLLGNLDPHTAYIPARDLEEVNSDLDGSFSGIGISFQLMNDTITVLEVISGGPSEKVGLLPGDRIITVNDTVVAGKNIDADDVKHKLRGPRNSKVELTILRP